MRWMAGKRGRPAKGFANAAAEIQRQIDEAWSKQSGRVIARTEEVAKEIVEEIKAKSPEKTGDYRKGWDWRREERADGYGGKMVVYIVYNKDRYNLTHLLNNGHATRNGGWVNGDQHITKIYKTVPKKLLDAAKEELNEQN